MSDKSTVSNKNADHPKPGNIKRKVVHLIAGARPNFMKIAPLYRALQNERWCDAKLIHTGQHYDANMSEAFFRDFGLPDPDVYLNIGSGSHGEQTGRIMIAYEQVCITHRPDWIIVVGDVNSTLACALVGVKLQIPVAHLEAGLRSGDRSMPEEINRIVTDAISDVLWTPSEDANTNLLTEGVSADKIECVGNIMIDAFELMRTTITSDQTSEKLGLKGLQYGVVTLHRPSNVDRAETLAILVDQLIQASTRLPLVFAVHPRTRHRLIESGYFDALEKSQGIRLIDPLSYVQFMNLVMSARLVVTDSGGVQEETTYLGIPCLTLRENTERPVSITAGTNRLVKPDALTTAVNDALGVVSVQITPPPLWDGETAVRVARSLERRLTG